MYLYLVSSHFWSLCCLFFDLRLLITPLVSSHFSSFSGFSVPNLIWFRQTKSFKKSFFLESLKPKVIKVTVHDVTVYKFIGEGNRSTLGKSKACSSPYQYNPMVAIACTCTDIYVYSNVENKSRGRHMYDDLIIRLYLDMG